ncbi:SDR family NAD(P)-dependent oxidoreductase [Mycolicibacterium confluentis]|uniref:3-hydroxy-2-methylbutyryl-CoA dehydrogenase n=1 Tax=Mycolicibacterium confluentis TaxID=28047 RepID=A0A7I7Y202_9MYCO|nr:SDR family NAD(P)-dependent oxidoreductase [Mycolicibacterium confluentis]MCV7320594.1 SDR family NAD(P)-dependent oxidoreductase [Mycolicibacterium confluentis]ORV30247.1 3-hydroxy-2-methylbutyryl-CoA dehydrogenase [Mycolicibacterium confluentis]BBZ35636.1 3-hydroxy-2-methylbutyryl-CoA dehydrogenase [Mycolicibacterium confluentis]
MQLEGASAVITGGASGLGLATAQRLVARGCHVILLDLPTSQGAERAADLGDLASFEPADVTEPESVGAAFAAAEARGPVRAAVHCAGRGGTVRVLNRDGGPGDGQLFEDIVRLNIVGTYNLLRYAASSMAKNDHSGDDRGVIIFTASVAAFEGQVGQLPYATSKAGVVGMTLVAARDLAQRQIRVNTIAPGPFDTPILDRFGDDVRRKLYEPVPHPNRLGKASEYAMLAEHIIDNSMLNGETIRLDGAVRMPPRPR